MTKMIWVFLGITGMVMVGSAIFAILTDLVGSGLKKAYSRWQEREE